MRVDHHGDWFVRHGANMFHDSGTIIRVFRIDQHDSVRSDEHCRVAATVGDHVKVVPNFDPSQRRERNRRRASASTPLSSRRILKTKKRDGKNANRKQETQQHGSFHEKPPSAA